MAYPLIHLSAFEAQMMYRDQTQHVTIDTFKELLATMGEEVTDENATIMYLSHLCACGYMNEVCTEIEKLENKTLLNTPHKFLTGGTILHWALYWNAGNRGRMIYELLTYYGAIHKMNYLNEYPFEQDGNKWICLTDLGAFGTRSPLEFLPIYSEIADKADKPE